MGNSVENSYAKWLGFHLFSKRSDHFYERSGDLLRKCQRRIVWNVSRCVDPDSSFKGRSWTHFCPKFCTKYVENECVSVLGLLDCRSAKNIKTQPRFYYQNLMTWTKKDVRKSTNVVAPKPTRIYFSCHRFFSVLLLCFVCVSFSQVFACAYLCPQFEIFVNWMHGKCTFIYFALCNSNFEKASHDSSQHKRRFFLYSFSNQRNKRANAWKSAKHRRRDWDRSGYTKILYNIRDFYVFMLES